MVLTFKKDYRVFFQKKNSEFLSASFTRKKIEKFAFIYREIHAVKMSLLTSVK